ncbi:hypothetical protein GGS20DRAFT_564788 [Poronia punctata]|nr:hypothetical protein GGS20DRAFT_564788 [Poronia punctata]
MTTALVEWPSSRTQDLVSLLVAITKVPGHIHRGEALDDEGKPRSWRRLPWIEMVWYDAHWMQPGMITRRASDDADRTRRRDIYVKIQNVESQLVAAGLFQWKHAFQYLIRALEKEPGPSDEVEAGNDGEADGQLKLDFHIPAAACWIQHNGKRLYDGLVNDELRGLNKRDIPSVARHFDHPLDRWEFWRNRFMKIRKNESDSFVKEAAATAADVMRNIQG